MKYVYWCVAILAASFLTGCGGGDGLTAVSGTVTFEGKPLSGGSITFVPVDKGETAAGQIDAQGKYTLSSSKPGANPGSYKVRITSYETPPEMNNPKSGKPAIPAKYFDANTSGLTTTVNERGPQVIDFPLTK